MTTKTAFIAALGGAKVPVGVPIVFTRSSGDILTATAHGLKNGAGPYKVMTANADAPSGLVAAVHATTFMIGTTMVVTDVLVVAGKSYTLIATPLADGDVDLGGSDTQTLANIAAAINQNRSVSGTSYDLDTVPNPTVGAEVTGIDVFTITAKTLDATLGNAITVASGDVTMVVDNAVLENGVDGTDYFIIVLSADTFSLATSKANALAGTAQALADAGTGIHELVRTVDTLADELWNAFVGATATVGRVFQVLSKTGWVETVPNRIVPGDTFRVQDDGNPVGLVPELDPDPGVYTAAQVQQEGVHFVVQLTTGGVVDRVATFAVA